MTAATSNLCLERVGGIPAESVCGLILTEAARCLEVAFTLEERLHELASRLEQVLFRLVPQTTGQTDLRRRILRLKRNMHNLRSWAEAEADVNATILAIQDPVEREQLVEWRTLSLRYEAAMADAAARFEQELQQANTSLRDALQRADLQQSLALASPSLLRDLVRASDANQISDWRPGSKRARSGLGYVARAALKTSPFSGLTTVTLAGFDSTPARPTRLRVTRLARTIPHALVQAMAQHPVLSRCFDYEANGGIRAQGDDGAFAFPKMEYGGADSFAWRNENWTRIRLNHQRTPGLSQFLLHRGRASYSKLVAILSADGFADPHTALTDLLERQLLRVVEPYSPGDANPLDALSSVIEHENAPLSTLLRRIQQQAIACADADGAARLALLAEMRRDIASAFELCASPVLEWLEQASLVFEDVAFEESLRLPHSVRDDLERLADLLRPRMFRVRIYEYLYRYFLTRYGGDGEVTDVLQFLRDFLERPEGAELWGRGLFEDRMVMDTGHAPQPDALSGESASPPTLAMFVQIVADSREAMECGDYQIVLNQVTPGQGGLLGRFAGLWDDEPDGLGRLLEDWLNHLYSGKTVLEMPLMADWNNLQSPQRPGLETLQWHGENPSTRNDRHTTFTDLRLRIDQESGTFRLLTKLGRTVAPVYLGTVPVPLMGSQNLRLFLRLIDPWLMDPRGGSPPDSAASEGIHAVPRQSEGRLVLRRASWRVEVRGFPRKEPSEQPFDYWTRLARWRREHGLPEEVFATVEREHLSAGHKNRKPVWVHFDSPHTIELLWSLAGSDAVAFVFTEALPSLGQHWLEDANGDRRVTEFAVLAGWPETVRPRTAAPVPSVSASAEEPGWIYLRIYPSDLEQVDKLVVNHLPRALTLARSLADVSRWFFIRYIDSTGPHVRLRLQVKESLEHTREELASLFREAGALVETDRYRPEYEKYGCGRAMLRAERNFEISSEVAVQTLQSGVDREAAALAQMERLVARQVPKLTERCQFLLNYARYWSRGKQEEKEIQPASLLSDCHLDCIQLDAADCTLFDVVHMHNNRLGIAPSTEAQLAITLAAFEKNGGRDRTRTCDLLRVKHRDEDDVLCFLHRTTLE